MDQLWSETCGAITIVHFEADYTSLAPEQLAGIRECLFGLTAFVQVPWLLFDLVTPNSRIGVSTCWLALHAVHLGREIRPVSRSLQSGRDCCMPTPPILWRHEFASRPWRMADNASWRLGTRP